jgi:3-phosphoshikimate 1-carboxyvinyltransferase
MNFSITRNNKSLKGELHVPASKSISNRLLIIQALTHGDLKINNISDSEDTKVLVKALQSYNLTIDIGHAGTSMRFLTAYFASRECDKILTGSERMKNRPIGNLIDALRQLGANISYVEKEGFPPILIKGKLLKGGKVSINSSVSSQFTSALLLSSPTFIDGIELHLESQVISSSYIEMTLKIMEYLGVKAVKEQNVIKVSPQTYKAKDITVEGDWSGVSYWYQAAAFSDDADIFIHSLQKDSFQGDARCAEIFSHLGISTEYNNEGIRITRTSTLPKRFDFDFIENPDLVQTLAVTCVMLNVPFRFSGTQSLRVKETDRIAALQNELAKFGATLQYESSGILEWDGTKKPIKTEQFTIATYDDHRMALSFAPIALLGKKIIIEDPEVVKKSYPAYWGDMRKMGFEVKGC